MIPDSDVELPARLADWGTLYGIPRPCVEAALDYRRDHANDLDFDRMKALVLLAQGEYEAGQVLGPVCEHCGQDIEPTGGA